jgi:predicted PurR-regulated permease PerM
MTTRYVTISLLLLGILTWLGWDIYAASNVVKGDTISEIVLAFTFRHWFASLVLGVVCGHLFWPVEELRDKWIRIAVLCVAGIFSFVIDLVGVMGTIFPMLPFLAGIVLGHICWPQVKKVEKYI